VKNKFLLLLVLALHCSSFCASNNDGNSSVKHKQNLFSVISYPFKIMWNHKKKVAAAALGLIAFRFYLQNKKFYSVYERYESVGKNSSVNFEGDLKQTAECLMREYKSWFALPSQKKLVHEAFQKSSVRFVGWKICYHDKYIRIVKMT
jgi:hypothetical protein